MAYLYEYNYYIPYHLMKGMLMKICINCQSFFKPRAQDKACSIKCKILSTIKIDKNNCWVWQGSTIVERYGKIRWYGKWYSAHRASYLEYKGEIPLGKLVCHSCDNKLCVNPEHLWLGTTKENIQDAINKKRKIIATNASGSLFTDNQIEEMRILKKEGFSLSRLTRIFNCSMVYLSKIIKNSNRKEKNGV